MSLSVETIPGPIVCAGCGCLCDDIQPAAHTKPVCPRRDVFLQQLPGFTQRAWVRQQPETPATALAAAARLLREAQAPGILGLNLVTVETCAAAVRLAAQLEAWLSPWPPDPIRFWGHGAPDLARSRMELEQDAALVIYLGFAQGVDAVQPRHRERHLARGQGLQRRQLQLNWEPQERLANIIALRLHLERDEVLPPHLQELSHAITSAPSIQLFFLAQLAQDDPAYIEQWQLLAARQRAQRRMGVSLLGSTGKARTVTESLTWLTGYPGPIRFAGGHPAYWPHVGEVEQLLRHKSLDVVLWLGMNPTELWKSLPAKARASVQEIVIAADPPRDVDIALQVPGLDPQLDAHVVRGDGIMLRLAGKNPGVPDPLAEYLQAIMEATS